MDGRVHSNGMDAFGLFLVGECQSRCALLFSCQKKCIPWLKFPTASPIRTTNKEHLCPPQLLRRVVGRQPVQAPYKELP